MLKSPTISSDRATDSPARATVPEPRVDDDDRLSPSLDPRPKGDSPAFAAHDRSAAEWREDTVIQMVTREVTTDPEATGLLLHGSRALGTASVDSNYDFVCLLRPDAYNRRRQRGTTIERRIRDGSPTVEIEYESNERFRRGAYARTPRGATLASAMVLVDKVGDIQPLMEELARPAKPVPALVADEYDRYLHGFAHSLKAWSRGDDLGVRAHAAQSALALMTALFALEGKGLPYLDHLSTRLNELDEPQGWRPGFLTEALRRLFYAPDPPFQQMLERRVSRLMDSRGIRHEWRHDLDRLRAVSYDEL